MAASKTHNLLSAFLALGLGACDEAATPDEELPMDDATVTPRTAKITPIGQEIAIAEHLEDGEEFTVSKFRLLLHGQDLLAADWTAQEGGGRPLTKGTGGPLSDPSSPLVFPRNFNRVSAPDANACAGCHNKPFGIVGGGGDIVANVFVLAHRFDFATFDFTDIAPTRGAVDENGDAVTLQSIANSRATPGMFGSGFIEMLARQMTADLQEIRDGIPPAGEAALTTKGVSFGTLSRDADGSWETKGVEGLPAPSLSTTGPDNPPNLIIRPFHQAGAVVSLRQFTNNAMNHHHGIQTTERFGFDTDPDGDGFTNEMTIADVTAASIFQAAMSVPGQVIPDDDTFEDAIANGESLFSDIGCASCHTPALPLDNGGWIYSEPNPYNPPGNLQVDETESLSINLSHWFLPGVRLEPEEGVVWVPAFTDLKLHDITDGPDDPNREPIDMMHAGGSDEFFAGNSRFLTKKLWGSANEAPFFHHGLYATLREAVLAHGGEAADVRAAFEALSDYDKDSVIEFLKSQQVLPPWVKHRVVNEYYFPKKKK
jgi:hypothetical protein